MSRERVFKRVRCQDSDLSREEMSREKDREIEKEREKVRAREGDVKGKPSQEKSGVRKERMTYGDLRRGCKRCLIFVFLLGLSWACIDLPEAGRGKQQVVLNCSALM